MGQKCILYEVTFFIRNNCWWFYTAIIKVPIEIAHSYEVDCYNFTSANYEVDGINNLKQFNRSCMSELRFVFAHLKQYLWFVNIPSKTFDTFTNVFVSIKCQKSLSFRIGISINCDKNLDGIWALQQSLLCTSHFSILCGIWERTHKSYLMSCYLNMSLGKWFYLDYVTAPNRWLLTCCY